MQHNSCEILVHRDFPKQPVNLCQEDAPVVSAVYLLTYC